MQFRSTSIPSQQLNGLRIRLEIAWNRPLRLHLDVGFVWRESIRPHRLILKARCPQVPGKNQPNWLQRNGNRLLRHPCCRGSPEPKIRLLIHSPYAIFIHWS
uniref:(northern house mosquito) hypothetical protein n=1 Tax=Culex pipiens TaxID=7175 RepID=A0A8D8FNG8_CULPI